MSKASKGSQQRGVAGVVERPRVQEKRIDIPIVDNKEFRWKLKELTYSRSRSRWMFILASVHPVRFSA